MTEQRIVFVHDHKFRKINKKYYSTGGLSDSALKRYTDVFGEIIVIARIIHEHSTSDKYSEITNNKVKILDGSKLSSKEFEVIINESKGVISRMPSYLGYKALKYADKYKKPFLTEVVGCTWDALWNHSYKGKLLAFPSLIIMKRFVKKSKYVIYVTNDFLQKRYPTLGEEVSCSNVSLKDFDSKILKKRISKITNKCSSEKIIIGTTAAIDVRYKGQQYIIKALGKLKKEGLTNFEYQLVGGGDPTYLESIAKKNKVIDQISIIGSMPHHQVFNWLDSIDLYAQPSKQEGLPRGLIEAMSRGLPCFGAKTAGIPELINSKFIFSNSHKNIVQIMDILRNVDEDIMKEQSVINYKESMKYDKQIIDKRREKFLKNFKNYINKQY